MGAALSAKQLRQQPQYAAPIDRSNPLARGLVHSWGLNVIGAMSAYDAAGSATGAFAAGYVGPSGNTWQIGPTGYYLNYDDTGTGSTAGSVALAVGNSAGSGSPGVNTFSFCARVRVPSWGATQQTVYGSALDGIEIRINTAGKIELLKQQRASIGASTAAVPIGVDFDLGVSYNGATVNFYINGVPAGSATSAQTFILSAQFYLGLAVLTSGTERLTNGSRIYRADVWNRVVAPVEFAAWSANPWQVLKAPQRQFFSAVVAAQDVSGVFSSSMDGAVLNASGAAIASGSLASTLGNATMNAAGAVGNTPSGTLASTLSGCTMAAAGAVSNAGAFASMLGQLTMSASGSVAQPAAGAFASTLGGVAMSAGGYVGIPPVITGVIVRRRQRPRVYQRIGS